MIEVVQAFDRATIAELDSDDAAALDRKIETARRLFADRSGWLKTYQRIEPALGRRPDSRKSGSHKTPCWRGMDSNPRSPVRERTVFETAADLRSTLEGDGFEPSVPRLP